MAVKVIQIPTINDASADFQKLFVLLSQVRDLRVENMVLAEPSCISRYDVMKTFIGFGMRQNLRFNVEKK